MSTPDAPALFRLHHCYEPHDGLETLYFCRRFDPQNDPDSDPNVIKLVGPTSAGECLSVIKCVKTVLSEFGIEIREEDGADD